MVVKLSGTVNSMSFSNPTGVQTTFPKQVKYFYSYVLIVGVFLSFSLKYVCIDYSHSCYKSFLTAGV